ncbi:hypothetical protein [Allokutzneria sp. NRRL B-24872]|uniref:hypothetical protein n=1 Tax=Allokutzneria sp. NRRL B-24872 TaxID=1137961 RepID=UPI0011787C65|nr:hypothetical protein [Allokutzneria sp. NRRL B-24872]
MLKAAYLAGVVTAHAAARLADGEVLPPLMGYEHLSGRSYLSEIGSDGTTTPEMTAREGLEGNEHGAVRGVLVVDGRIEFLPEVDFALLIDIVEYGPVRQTMQLLLPYRHARSPRGFALHELSVVNFDNIADADEAPILARIFDGVYSLPAHVELWDKHFEKT